MNQAAMNVLKQDNPYRWIQQERIGDWYIMSGQSVFADGAWTAWCKDSPMQDRQPMCEPGDVYFEFGSTREQAIGRLIVSDLPAKPVLLA